MIFYIYLFILIHFTVSFTRKNPEKYPNMMSLILTLSSLLKRRKLISCLHSIIKISYSKASDDERDFWERKPPNFPLLTTFSFDVSKLGQSLAKMEDLNINILNLLFRLLLAIFHIRLSRVFLF